MPHTASTTIAERIQELYQAPLADLGARADAHRGSMLAALLAGHSDLQFAEQNIDFQLQRLRELTAPEREIGPYDAGHILDCARRIAESVVVRDVHTKTASAVLDSLRRAPAPQAKSPTHIPPAVPAPAAAAAPTR
ncbi:hypothetical protein [Streptomyces sp. NPDC093589]|uniref:hypothetical protein n=1 Tax=Streptomyces sp. NPDC093589 TaxID=3366043 RepID=UPI00380F71E5